MWKLFLLGVYDWAARKIRKVLIAHYGNEVASTIAREARQEFKSLIPELPDIGGLRNSRTQLIVSAALFLALYKALKARGKPVEEIGALVYEMVEAAYSSYPRFLLRMYGKRYFAPSVVRRTQKLALESQERRYSGDWVFTFVMGDGKAFDWGMDFVKCGICEFFHAEGADEFTPYMCRLDFAASDWFGWGLMRTTELATGGERCDFRFKRPER
jgi:hypothetical protein